MEEFRLPETFLFGTATAATQIEGGDTNNSWFRWAQQGHIKDGASPVRADDHWNRVAEDIQLMKDINQQTYRLSLEWSRIEPEEGRFSDEAIAHYEDELRRLIDAGIRPLVTLHHFSNPLWLEDDGSWENAKVVERFTRFVGHVVEKLGDYVSDWVTINEPNVYASMGYLYGVWPPGRKSPLGYFRVARNMILAHLNAYRVIHEIRRQKGHRDTLVGVAHHLRVFDPMHDTWTERRLCELLERYFQDIFTIGMTEGRLVRPLGTGYPLGGGRFSDFFGLNYYSRSMVSFSPNPGSLFVRLSEPADAPKNDLGWEIYPEGLYRIARQCYERYRLPIFITENGTCDAKDAFRAKFIYDHLYQVKRLIDAGVDVQRYYHWSLMDNFEWLEGESARFGLYAVDYRTQKRTLRESGKLYGQISKAHAVTAEMIEQFNLQG